MWCVPELDQEYVERMEDVLALYEKPVTVEEPVVCVDEKSVSLREEVREAMPLQPGRVGDGMGNINAVARPMCFVEWRRKPECTSRR
jgi:hypothetical protein